MKNHHDLWYIQLPDGRVVKAKSTASVRHHVEAGNIPLNSLARREPSSDWQSLTWIDVFSDLSAPGIRSANPNHDAATAPPSTNGSSPDINSKSGISARLDPMRLQTVGIRGLVDELIAAFDSTVNSGKLVVACVTSLFGSLAVFLIYRLMLLAFPESYALAEMVSGVSGLFALAFIVGLLTRQTHLEVSKMRPVHQSEAWQGSGVFIRRVFFGYAATLGVGIGLIVFLHHVPEWVANAVSNMQPNVAEALQTASWGVATALAVVVFAGMLLSLSMPPILVVEDCSVGDAIREWRSLIREHRIRFIVYEGMALAVAVVAALPLLLPVELALRYGPPITPLNQPNWSTEAIPVVLQAVAAGPALAFLAVANLFIYLNLRYEFTPNK